MVRALPRPSLEQTYRFAWFVAEAHSWYKHLPADRTVPFAFYLDPYAGTNLIVTPTGEVAVVEITDESTRFHYTWQTTTDYRRRFGHWNYLARYGTSFIFASDGGTVNSAGSGAVVLDEDGDWIEVPRPCLEAGKAEVNAFVHAHMVVCWEEIAKAKQQPSFACNPAAPSVGEQGQVKLAEPLERLVEERLGRATAHLIRFCFPWFGSSWFDEEWKETFEGLGGTSVELDEALSSFRRRLLVALAERGEKEDGVAGPLAFACERNRQLDEMRYAMLRFLGLIDR